MTPRFEFRAFASNFGMVERNVSVDAELTGLEDKRELYLVSALLEEHNVKVRDGNVDVKRLVRREGELELWKPEREASFPLSVDDVRATVMEPLGVEATPRRQSYSLAAVLTEVIFPEPDVVAVVVQKQRRSFRFGPNGSIRAEHARVNVNGAGVETIAVECESSELLSASIEMLGLGAYRNTSYVAALKCITGLTPFFGPKSALSVEQAWEKSVWEKR